MSDRELSLEELPRPPLFKLVDGSGADVFEETEVGGEPSTVGALFSSAGLAEEFSSGAGEFGMGSLGGLEARELDDWEAVEVYASSGEDYVIVVSEEGSGLFHAGDVARYAAERRAEIPLPLYLFSDERGEAPLISVETEEGEALVAALFSSPEKARAFRERASHLELPELLATIEDADGLRRNALVAREAGASYVVVDPESGMAEAIPIEELVR
jgi:hypothetical protein